MYDKIKNIGCALVVFTFMGGLNLKSAVSNLNPDTVISHEVTQKDLNLEVHKQRLKGKKEHTLPLDEELFILGQMAEFDMGRFLLKNKGFNGYWTAHMIVHGPKKESLHPLEKWILTKAPTVMATQERYFQFKKQLGQYIKSGDCIASIPCGLMDDLLIFDYSNLSDIELVGVDIDQESLTLAEKNATSSLVKNVSFLKRNAWDLKIRDRFNIILSNGLNIYEPDPQKCIALYKEFHRALKDGGVLITSFLTPPPALSPESTWRNYSKEDALRQKAIFSDILEAKWQTFRTENEVTEQLKRAGFRKVETIYDSQGIFPTIVAVK